MKTKKQTTFNPIITIAPAIAVHLMRIEAARQAIQSLPITPRALASLREPARLFSTHYSTMIEGNRLTQEQVAQVIGRNGTFRRGQGLLCCARRGGASGATAGGGS
jgi:hypothetical protein